MSCSPSDWLIEDSFSDCCKAPVIYGGRCSRCRENCEDDYDNDKRNPEEPMAGQKKRR